PKKAAWPPAPSPAPRSGSTPGSSAADDLDQLHVDVVRRSIVVVAEGRDADPCHQLDRDGARVVALDDAPARALDGSDALDVEGDAVHVLDDPADLRLR